MNDRTFGGNPFHTFDDAYTDPLILRLGIVLGASPFFNVQLALNEMEGRRDATHFRRERPVEFISRLNALRTALSTGEGRGRGELDLTRIRDLTRGLS